MSAKKRSRVLDFLVYLAIRVLVCVALAFPYELARDLSAWFAWLVYRIDKRHRLVARDNIEKAFPGKYTPQQIAAIVRGIYRHFARVLVEILFMPRRMHATNWRDIIELHDIPLTLDLLLSGRPVLFVTGHFGNWELSGYSLALFGFSTHAIARPIDNPYLDEFLRTIRERSGQTILAKHGDFDRIQEVLASGGVLGTLADQDAGQRGMFVDFFGRPASTHKAVAIMALEYNVPMIVCGTPFHDGKYHYYGRRVIDPADYANHPDAIRAITQQFTSDLESLIREYPEQYFWLHRRWKHQPQERKKKKSA